MNCNNRGFSLPEVLMGCSLAALVILGSAVIYLFGVDAWERTAVTMQLQSNGTAILREITLAIQKADSVAVDPSGKFIALRIPPFQERDTTAYISFEIIDGGLQQTVNGVSTMLIIGNGTDSLVIEDNSRQPIFRMSRDIPLAPRERVVDIALSLMSVRTKSLLESMDFTATVAARNAR